MGTRELLIVRNELFIGIDQMGLFDSLVMEQDVQNIDNLTDVEAFVGILMAALMADGDVSEEEKERFTPFLTKNKVFLQAALTSSGDVGNYMSKLVDKLVTMYTLDA